MTVPRTHLWLFVALACLLPPGAEAQDNALKRTRQKMSDSIGVTQDFLCSLTIERSQKRGTAAPVAMPVLKVDGGVINGKELFARPANEADVAAVQELLLQLSRGGTGPFALYSRPLFLTNNATFYTAPEETKDGRKLLRWEFAMPKETARYAPRVVDKTVALGYSGTFWADAESGDITRIELRADTPTPEMGLAGIVQSVDYGRVNIAGASVLLPVSSLLTLQEPAATESRIAIKYENCHKHLVQGDTKFIEGVTVTTNTTPEPSVGKLLPPGLNLDVTLEDPIDEKITSVGSKISFKLSKDVKAEGKVLAPKGSIISGHVTRQVRESYRVGETRKDYYLVGIQLDSMEAGGEKYTVVANLETVGPTTTITTFLPYSQAPDKWGLYDDIRDQVTFPPQKAGESILGLVRPYLRVPPRLRLVFSTTAASAP
jgi:hypothetical protein